LQVTGSPARLGFAMKLQTNTHQRDKGRADHRGPSPLGTKGKNSVARYVTTSQATTTQIGEEIGHACPRERRRQYHCALGPDKGLLSG